ncbi:L-2-hydroxyglutarate oxidase [Microlunatus aurantiacus]|uniref:L-2-hydroxyglutarate oxidase n=1 Tax=Microlunatus aurantiacus TaxID=446786 RepID=A0ABP7EFM2_9ACTN
MSKVYAVVVVGSGIVGLAITRELRRRHPDLDIAVVEKESGPGRHQSGHNSGVLHAGVYYKPGSLKARLCVEGKASMERFADEHGIPYETCGKLIVAIDDSELARLADLEERGRANNVPGLKMVGPEELREIEPHAAGIRALHSPGTGIIDFGRVVEVLAEELRRDGVDFYFDHEVTGLRRVGDTTVVETPRGEVLGRRLVTCAGLHSDRVAAMDSAPDVAIVPFRGDYYTLTPEARDLCRGLIYPVPDPSLPFLGVHFTKRVDGSVWAGPNAVLATAREGYRRRDIDLRDLTETVRYPGFPKLARRWWKVGAQEIWRDVVKAAFVKDLQKYVPDVRSDQLVFGPSGVRAQAVGSTGDMVDDFKLMVTDRSVHVLNAPSPAATASLAIASRLADDVDRAFSLREHAGGGPAS